MNIEEYIKNVDNKNLIAIHTYPIYVPEDWLRDIVSSKDKKITFYLHPSEDADIIDFLNMTLSKTNNREIIEQSHYILNRIKKGLDKTIKLIIFIELLIKDKNDLKYEMMRTIYNLNKKGFNIYTFESGIDSHIIKSINLSQRSITTSLFAEYQQKIEAYLKENEEIFLCVNENGIIEKKD